jgi:hypothetical protein
MKISDPPRDQSTVKSDNIGLRFALLWNEHSFAHFVTSTLGQAQLKHCWLFYTRSASISISMETSTFSPYDTS